MAKVSSVNLSPTTGSEAMFLLMEWLRDSMGFTITRSGDGLSAFDGTGTTVITSGSSGANGMANEDAHFTAQDPGGEYEWCFQRSSVNISWEIVVSALDGFTGGSATVRPTATDEQVLIDSTIFYTDGQYRMHLVGETVPEGVAVPVYSWRLACTLNGTGVGTTFIMHEAMESGSYPELVGTRTAPTTGEPDPSIYVARYEAAGAEQFGFLNGAGYWNFLNNAVAKGWYCMNGVNGNVEVFTWFYGCVLGAGASAAEWHFPAADSDEGVGVDPRDGSDPVSKFFIARGARGFVSAGPKGFTTTIRMKGVDRTYPDTVDVNGERFVYMHDLLLPFENGATPLT